VNRLMSYSPSVTSGFIGAFFAESGNGRNRRYSPPAWKQAVDLQAAILVALRKRNGGMVVGEGAPARWRLKESA
jgi:hypothetical protein